MPIPIQLLDRGDRTASGPLVPDEPQADQPLMHHQTPPTSRSATRRPTLLTQVQG